MIKIAILFFALFIILPGYPHAMTEYSVIADSRFINEEAIKVALQDLVAIGMNYGIVFKASAESKKGSENLILVGSAARNNFTAEFIKKGKVQLKGVTDPEGYEIRTVQTENRMVIIVAGGSLIGDVNGLYWMMDRIRVFKYLPELDLKREPALKIRYTRVPVNSKNDIKRALAYGLNLIYIRDPLSLVPWNAEPEGKQNQQNREKAKELIAYAHELHMQVVAFGTEFTYHPSLLEECIAKLSPCDTTFWYALQEKFRRLLRAMPELDGVAIFTGEEQSYWGNYQYFDPMHDDEYCEWSLEKRYRTFIKKIYDVVIGEFNKIYHHRTWITNCYEQQSRPEVYKKIFSAQVPVKNLYLIPSFTQNDRWWHQRYNPTFNKTPHNMLAVLESMNYYESSKSNIFPTYPGQYFQAGLQSILEVEDSNLKGVSFDLRAGDDYNTTSLTAYTVFRLEWDYLENPGNIAEDFCSIHFGKDVASEMADIYLLSPTAYKYGLFIEPVAYGEFNSLPHIRVGTFPARGYPSIDGGKEHLAFLRKIYLRCKPWIEETFSYLDHGLEISHTMKQKYKQFKERISNKELADDVENRLEMTWSLIKTNNLYIKSAFAYFAYRDTPIEENKRTLTVRFKELEENLNKFSGRSGFGYHLYGINQLLININQILDDFSYAEQLLVNAPNSSQIEVAIAEQQSRYKEILKHDANACVKILYWEGRVDGRDILHIKGDLIEVEHLRWDPIYFNEYHFVNPLPQKEGTVIVKDIESRSIHPFILEQPNEQNEYNAKVYLYDVPGGAGWFKFELYYISKLPHELGCNFFQ
jgi:hypothetical protein